MKPTAIRLSIIALLLAAPSGCKTHDPFVPPPVERIVVPLSSAPLRGPANAEVTIVAFSDFESTYSTPLAEILRMTQREFGNHVRIQYRHRPLPTHPFAQDAAEASAAAMEQGRFWQYYDILTSVGHALDHVSLHRYAVEANLDVGQFEDAISSGRARLLVDADSILAAGIGARGAPVLFVNGRPLRGLPRSSELEQVVQEELGIARHLVETGVAPTEVYVRLLRMANKPETPHGSSLSLAASSGQPRTYEKTNQDAVYKIPIGQSPIMGPSDALVTIVLWSDFECTACAETETLLERVASQHPQDVRVVWKGRPILDHPGAMLVVEAGLAANEQGKFWDMRNLLRSQPTQEIQKLEEYARTVGVNVEPFHQNLAERAMAARVAEDVDFADQLQIANLPTLFINGRRVERDDISLENLTRRVEEETRRVKELVAGGPSHTLIYEQLTQDGITAVAERLEDLPPLSNSRYLVDAGNSPSRGDPNAPITIIVFSDFQCPYCRRFEGTLQRLQAHFPGELRIVWKDSPSREHPDAMLAHEAARAAARQGHFWEMHDKIFAEPYLLRRIDLERHAKNIGLNMDMFRAALDVHTYRAEIESDLEYGVSLAGPSGTPTVFVNRRLIPGAYPYEILCGVIEGELQLIRHNR